MPREGTFPLVPAASLRRRLRGLWGLGRSLAIYHRPGRRRRLMRLYRPFVRPGGLCFDVGAHVGDRTACMRALGSRVVAVEPQPGPARFLQRVFGRDAGVTLVEAAVGAAPGRIELFVSPANPTVTTGSRRFLDVVARVPSFEGVRWDDRHEVPAVTLDGLIERFGRPDFVKLDIEGMEAEALQGLSQPLPALSFEFLPANHAEALRCLERLGSLGAYRFNVALGEHGVMLFETWQPPSALAAWLAERPADGPSGDVYAVLQPS